MRAKFPGNPKQYRKASIIIAVYVSVSVYVAFGLVKWFVHDELLLNDWKALLVIALFIPLYARFCFRWMMRLDAQYGSGRSWHLESCRVKLPEFRPPNKKD